MVRPLLAAAFSLLIASPAALAADAKQMEENKKIVAAFYDAAVNQKDFEKASQYLGARYTQHNPLAADGREGFKGFIAFLKEKFPNNRSEIKRIFADGDYVIVHVHAVREPGTRGNAIVDIFNLENGRALGRDPADPGESRQRQRHVLAVPVDLC
jgi:predicted SnoaL-like aldol condensation-catalyzing enzyme